MDLSMEMIWLIVFVVLLVAEIVTVSLTSIWFAAGALAAFVASLLCDIIWVQVLVFALVSFVLLIFTKPVANRFFNKNREKTNVDALAGKQGIVTETINNLALSGEVNLAGQMWMARTEDDSVCIEEGEKVVVKCVQGVKLIVEREDSKGTYAG